jgi:hypothetical protein
VGVVNEPIEDGIGVGGISDDVMPSVGGELAGDECGSSAIALFGDFEEFVARLGIDWLESEIV